VIRHARKVCKKIFELKIFFIKIKFFNYAHIITFFIRYVKDMLIF